MGDWTPPTDADGTLRTYDGPTLLVAGALSDYVGPDHADAMRAAFPAARLVTIKNAGHWVHSEQPQVFTTVLRQFAAGARA